MATSPQHDPFDPYSATHNLHSNNVSGRSTPKVGVGSTSRPGSIRAASTAFHVPGAGVNKYFRSRRIRDVSTIPKPWTEVKDKKKKWHTIFPAIGLATGIALVALECYLAILAVPNHKYCSVYEVDFTTGGQLDPKIWTKEAAVGGFGNGEFDETTVTDENSFIKDGELWIKPTLQDASLITQNSVIDLTKDGICQSDTWATCHAVTNITNGTIVPPVKSARLNTKKGASIKYGRVEVTAALPAGDWMWPAIWMLPVEEKYGPWPASGEIDIVESRGNNYTYAGGNTIMTSSLHWGPSPLQDAWKLTYSGLDSMHTTFSKTYFTFGLEWSEKYIFTYLNSRLKQVMYIPFKKPRWPQGHFDESLPVSSNGTLPVDPWSQTGRDSTPFDQDFYLILNVAVGGTNGWFQDGYHSKPWVDASPTAKRDFWEARDQWYPTWEKDGQMKVKSIKMLQQAGYNGC